MFLFNVYVYENKLYYPLRAGDVCIFTFRWRAVPQRKLHLQLSSSIMASSRPASAPASWAGPRRVGLPAVGHFRRARVSFDSAFKLSCRTSAAATFSAVLWQKNRPYHQPDRAALIFFRHEFWSVWGGPARFCEQDSGSRWTITAVALLTAARCIIFFLEGVIPLLAPGRNWIAVTWCCACERHDLGFCLFFFSWAVFVYWEILVNNNKVSECGGFRPSSTSGLELGRIDGLDDESAFERVTFTVNSDKIHNKIRLFATIDINRDRKSENRFQLGWK